MPRMPSQTFLITPHPPQLQGPSMPPHHAAFSGPSVSYSDHELTPHLMPGSLLSPAMDDGIGPASRAKKHLGGRATLCTSFSPSSSHPRAESIIHMRLCYSHTDPVEGNCCSLTGEDAEVPRARKQVLDALLVLNPGAMGGLGPHAEGGRGSVGLQGCHCGLSQHFRLCKLLSHRRGFVCLHLAP